MPTIQARYWMLTIPRDDWTPALPESAGWLVGQPEIGENTGYRHHQLLVWFSAKKTLAQVKRAFCNTAHCEAARSASAETYVRKEETRDGEPYEFGSRPINRNSAPDWQRVKDLAKQGSLDAIPADIYIRHYRTLKTIAADHDRPLRQEKNVVVYYGGTGTGKSHRAFEEAGDDAYVKDPRSKFWCGYRGEKHVIIDEFRGGIDIAHILRWLDKYPVRVELKGSSCPLAAENIWITSNLHPRSWYPELDEETVSALLRRVQITEFPINTS